MGIPTSTRRMIKRDMARYSTHTSSTLFITFIMMGAMIALPYIACKKMFCTETTEHQPKFYTREEVKEMDKKFFSVLGIIIIVFLILVGIGFLAQYGLI